MWLIMHLGKGDVHDVSLWANGLCRKRLIDRLKNSFFFFFSLFPFHLDLTGKTVKCQTEAEIAGVGPSKRKAKPVAESKNRFAERHFKAGARTCARIHATQEVFRPRIDGDCLLCLLCRVSSGGGCERAGTRGEKDEDRSDRPTCQSGASHPSISKQNSSSKAVGNPREDRSGTALVMIPTSLMYTRSRGLVVRTSRAELTGRRQQKSGVSREMTDRDAR